MAAWIAVSSWAEGCFLEAATGSASSACVPLGNYRWMLQKSKAQQNKEEGGIPVHRHAV